MQLIPAGNYSQGVVGGGGGGVCVCVCAGGVGGVGWGVGGGGGVGGWGGRLSMPRVTPTIAGMFIIRRLI